MWRNVLMSVAKHRHIAQSRGLFVAAKWQPAVPRNAVQPSLCYSTTSSAQQESNEEAVDTLDFKTKQILDRLRKSSSQTQIGMAIQKIVDAADKNADKGFIDVSFDDVCEMFGLSPAVGTTKPLAVDNVAVPPKVLNLIASMYMCTTATEGFLFAGNKDDFAYSLLVPILATLFPSRFTLRREYYIKEGGRARGPVDLIVADEVVLLVTRVNASSLADGRYQNMVELFAAAKVNSEVGVQIPVMGIVTTADQWQLQQYDPNKTGSEAWLWSERFILADLSEDNSVEYWMKKVAPVAGLVHWALLTQEERFKSVKQTK